ncbi:MAG: SH3-like domain-containing protein [Pseudomonadota bacterium]
MSRALQVGEAVTVDARYPDGHIRTPYYIRGKTGVVCAAMGEFPDPEVAAANGRTDAMRALYRVRFLQRDTWADYAGSDHDTIDIEIYAHWLTPIEEAAQ